MPLEPDRSKALRPYKHHIPDQTQSNSPRASQGCLLNQLRQAGVIPQGPREQTGCRKFRDHWLEFNFVVVPALETRAIDRPADLIAAGRTHASVKFIEAGAGWIRGQP